MKNERDAKSLIFVGDIFVSQEDTADVVKIINSITDGNVLIANLEGAPEMESQSHCASKKNMNLRISKYFLNSIHRLNNVLFSLVNNHITDNGLAGFRSVKDTLGKKALYSLTNEDDPRKYIEGHSLLFFADEREECLCEMANFLRFDLSAINANREFVSGSIIIVHGGIEYRRYPTFYQRKLSLRLIDLGAHSVIFHHSHIVGVHEFYKGRLIHYGLGNFYFSEIKGMHGIENINGCALKLKVDSYNYEVATVKYSSQHGGNEVDLSLVFKPIQDSPQLPDIELYKKFYKIEYKVNASLRPRQLFDLEILNRIQFNIWYAFASRISRAGFSTKLKRLIHRLSSAMGGPIN